MTSLLVIPLLCVAAFCAAWSLASVVVVALDALGLVYNPKRERDDIDHHDPEPVQHPHRRPYVVSHDQELAAAIRAAVDIPPRELEPLRRRIAAYRESLP